MSYSARATALVLAMPVDLLYATSTPLTVAIPALIRNALRGTPYVFEVRDLWPDVAIAMGSLNNPVLRWMARRLERMAYRRAHAVVVLNPAAVDHVRRLAGSAKAVIVSPNACDAEFAQVGGEERLLVRAMIPGLNEADPLLLYAGSFGRVNDAGWLCEVIGHLRAIGVPAQLLMIGDGSEREAIIAQAAALRLLDVAIHVWDPKPKADMPAIYAAADLVTSVVANVPECAQNSANKVFDGLAANKPVAVNHLGWIADLIVQKRVGLVLDRDTAIAASQLRRFLRDPAAIRLAANNARALADGPLSRDLLVSKISVLLTAVVQSKVDVCHAAGDEWF